MPDRILEIGDTAARLRIRNGLLSVLDGDDRELGRVVLSELSCLVLGHPALTVSHVALSEIAKAGGSVVVTDDRRQPIAWMVPLGRHSTLAERFRLQAEAGRPLRKRLWQRLVRAKIAAQGRLLVDFHGDDAGLEALAARVRSGDPENLEAQAAQRYWPRLFGDSRFRRRRDGEDPNRHLNYGYAVLRSLVARALCGAGLHPGLGLHHRNRYDDMPLADDVMEPFRPIVDRAVAALVLGGSKPLSMSQDERAALLGPFLLRREEKGENRTLFDRLARTASSLARSFENGAPALELPEL